MSVVAAVRALANTRRTAPRCTFSYLAMVAQRHFSTWSQRRLRVSSSAGIVMRACTIGAVNATQTSAAYAAGVQESNYSSGSVRLIMAADKNPHPAAGACAQTLAACMTLRIKHPRPHDDAKPTLPHGGSGVSKLMLLISGHSRRRHMTTLKKREFRSP